MFGVTVKRRSSTEKTTRRRRRLLLVAMQLALVASCGSHEVAQTNSAALSRAGVGDNAPLPVPPDTITPPTLYKGKVIDSLTGTSQVSADGQARYSIPLWVPPGRANMEPTLSLEYASRGGNGILGVGWSVSGLSAIARCPHTVASDGVAGPIKFDDSDAFCLDGQHLKQVGVRPDGARVFHTERDIFANVVMTPGPSGPGFTVFQKSGRIDEYTGFALQRKSYANWYISKSRDHYGNTIQYTYRHDTGVYGLPGEAIYPLTIDYTGSDDKSHPLMANRSVKFIYNSKQRSDTEFNAASGALLLAATLSAIEMWGPDTQGQAAMLRRYAFTYTGGSTTRRTLLRSIAAVDATGNSMQTTDLQWELGSAQLTRFDSAVSDYAASESLRGLQLSDINQDGFADLLYVVKDSSGNAEYAVRLWSPGLGDFGPLFELHIKPSKDRWGQFTFPRVALSDNTSIGILLWGNPPATNWTEPQPLVQQIRKNPDGTLRAAEYAIFDPSADLISPADFDGDGLADVLSGWTKIPAPQFAFSRNLAQGSVTFAGGAAINAPADAVKPSSARTRAMRTADFDGDNRQEIAVCSDLYPNSPIDGTQSYTISNSGITVYRPFIYPTDGDSRGLISCDPRYNAIYADVNGDGLDDTIYPSNGPYPPLLRINRGPTSIADNDPGFYGPADASNHGASDATVQLMDYDHDGRPDTITIVPNVGVYFNKWASSTIDPTITPTSTTELAVGDVNGDGFDDLVQQENGHLAIYRTQGKKPDTLTRVVDGFGGETRFTYQPITSPTVYTPDPSSYVYTYPLRAVSGGMWVVSKHEVPNGVSSTQPTAYFHTYGGAVDDVQRGFQGFNSHSVSWFDRGLRRIRNEAYDNVSRYFFVEPFAGLPTSIDTLSYDATGKVVHEELLRNRYNMKWSDGQNIYFPYTASSTESTFDLDASGALVQTASHNLAINGVDYYGNVTSALFDNGARETRDLEITYKYATGGNWSADTQWLIDEPIQITDTSHINLPPPLHGRYLTRRSARQYDAAGGLAWKIEEPDYDGSGNVVPLAQPQPDGIQTKFTHYLRDWDGQVGAVSRDINFTPTPSLRVRTYFHDDPDRVFVTRIKDEMGHFAHLAMHPGLGVLAASQGPDGNYRRSVYDTFGRLVRSEQDGGETLFTTYSGYAGAITVDPAKTSPLITQLGAAGSSIISRLDPKGRLVKTVTRTRNDGANVSVDVTYDEFGRVSTTTRPYFDGASKSLDTFVYDAAGRLHRSQLADGRVEQLDYFGAASGGLQTDHYDADPTDPLVLKSTTVRDYAGRITSSTQHARAKDGRPARDVTVQYAYGNWDQLTAISDSAGSVAVNFDRMGRQIFVSDPSRGMRAYAFDVFGGTLTETLADSNGNPGEVRQRHYDNLGRPLDLTTRDGVTTWVWDTSPNGVGQLAMTTSPSGVSRSFGYDAQNRLVDELVTVDGKSYDVTRVPDNFGRLSKLLYPAVNGARFTLRYEYGALGALSAIKDDATNAPFWTLLERDAGNALTNPSGAFAHHVLGNNLARVHFNEDAARPGRLKSIQSSTGVSVQSLSYGFDSKGFLQTRADGLSGLQESYDYDELNRLEHWTVAATAGPSRVRYDYDDVGNLTARAYEVGAGANLAFDYLQLRGGGPYAISDVGSRLFTYDVEGNQSQAGARTVTPSAFGLPLAIGDQSSFQLRYDAGGARIQKKSVNGANSDDTVTISGLYQRHASGTGPADHLYTLVGPRGAFAQVAETDGKSGRAPYYVLSDQLGSADTILDATGKVVETRKFDPYGNRIDPKNPLGTAPAPASPVALGFTGHEHDWELGLINMKGRLFDPTTARFISPDPMMQSPLTAVGLNSYAYAEDRPTTMTDPSGFTSEGEPPPPPPTPSPPGDQTQQPMPGQLGTTTPQTGGGGNPPPVHPNAVDAAGLRAANNAADRARIFFGSKELEDELWLESVFEHTGTGALRKWMGDEERRLDDERKQQDRVARADGTEGTTLLDIIETVTDVKVVGTVLSAGAGAVGRILARRAIVAVDTGAAESAVVNGNSVLSRNAQHVYKIVRTDAAGNTELYKYGISGGPLNAEGLSVRAERQVRALTRAACGQFSYESSIVRMIPGGQGARGAALALEKDLVYDFFEATGAKPPGNIRP